MRLLITGATGFLGSHAARHLAERPDVEHVVATGRSRKTVHDVDHPKVEYVLGDLAEPATVTALFSAAPTHVVNCASLSSPWGRAADFERANVATQALLIAAAERAGVERFVYVSSPSIYALAGKRLGVREADPLPRRHANHYARTKVAAEALLAESRLAYVTLRPRGIVGAGDTVIMPRLLRAHRAGRLRVVGSGRNVVDLTPVRSVVAAVERALAPELPPAALRQAYNVTNGAPVELWPTIDGVLRRLGEPPVEGRLPRWLGLAAAGFAEARARLTPGRPEPALTRYGIRVLADSTTLDIAKARQLLGYVPAQGLDEALDEYVGWHQTLAS